MGNNCASILIWPFKLLFDLIVFILQITLRIITAVIGLVLVIAGLILCLTIIGAVVGIPLAMFGFMLMVRSIS